MALIDRIFMDGVTFDDVLLCPAYSDVLPREVDIQGRFSRHIDLKLPFVSAAMDTVTEAPMAIAMARAGALGVIHKNMTIDQQAAQVAQVKAEGLMVAAGVGATTDILERVTALVNAGVDAIVLDSAHGHSKGIITALKSVKKAFPELDVVAGNIATAQAAVALIEAGADGLKVGIGPGSICTTRIVAGVGMPQLSAIAEVAAVSGDAVPVIADGGMRYSGDVVKALAAGAHCAMCGSLFAGTDEAPGEIEEINGVKTKIYRGMGSIGAMLDGSADRYFQKGTKKLVPEGVAGRVAYKGPVADVLYQLEGGLRSGMGYCGAYSLRNLRSARLVRISSATVRENHPHDIDIILHAPNYHG